MSYLEFSSLLGKTLVKAENVNNEEIRLEDSDGRRYLLYHDQDCCESVYVEDIIGDLSDLIGSPLTMAEEVSSDDPPPDGSGEDSHTWTFYKFATVKGYVTIRWYGESNGYYSESVSFKEIKEGDE